MFGFGCAWLYRIGATFMLPAGLIAIATLPESDMWQKFGRKNSERQARYRLS